MFRNMRRSRQELTIEECHHILKRHMHGTLAVDGDDGYPYTVPLSYVFDGGSIYFHCAQQGHKLDAIHRNSKVSFCVIDCDEIKAEEYTTCFRSVIVFGRIRIISNQEEKRKAITKLAKKYAPEDRAEHREAAIQKDWKPLCVLELSIEHISGKQSIELINQQYKG